MLVFPAANLADAERRARQILQHGVECNDKQLLTELWCALRNAEAVYDTDEQRKPLRRLRDEVCDAIAKIEVPEELAFSEQQPGRDSMPAPRRADALDSETCRRSRRDKVRRQEA